MLLDTGRDYAMNMKRIFLAIALIILTTGIAVAQDVPAIEVFGGYSILKLGMSNNDIKMIQDAMPEVDGGWNVTDSSFVLSRGGNGSVAFNINEHFGIAVDARYNQGNWLEGSFGLISPELPVVVQTPFVIGMKNVSALAGPRFSLRREHTTMFVHALAGLDYWRLTGSFTAVGEKNSTSDNHNGFGVAIGGGFDVNVNERIAVRVIQADYYITQHMERRFNNANLSFGIVFKIGEKY